MVPIPPIDRKGMIAMWAFLPLETFAPVVV
jgi:hypothetical protein